MRALEGIQSTREHTCVFVLHVDRERVKMGALIDRSDGEGEPTLLGESPCAPDEAVGPLNPQEAPWIPTG